jgi:hypothetical protein
VVIETGSFGSPAILFLAITEYSNDQGPLVSGLGANALGYLVSIDPRYALDDLLRGAPSSGSWVAAPTGEVATPSGERQAGLE